MGHAGKDISAFKDTSYAKYKEVDSLHSNTLLLEKSSFYIFGSLISMFNSYNKLHGLQKIYSTWIPQMHTVHTLEVIIFKASTEEDSYVKQWFGAPSQFCGAAMSRRVAGFSLKSKSVLTALVPTGRQAQEGPTFLLL